MHYVNALGGYFETLYELNRDLITLCGLDVQDNDGQYEIHSKNVIQAIPRLIPYVKNREKIEIKSDDGLLEFSGQIWNLKTNYESILNKHYSLLSKVKDIRNAFEHKMHGVRLDSAGSISNAVAFDLTYSVKGEKITLTAKELIDFTKDVNCLFSNIQKMVEEYAYKNNKSDNLYYRRLVRYDYRDFNLIYDSNLLVIVGKAFFAF